MSYWAIMNNILSRIGYLEASIKRTSKNAFQRQTVLTLELDKMYELRDCLEKEHLLDEFKTV